MATIAEIEAEVVKLPAKDRERLLRVISASLDGEAPKMPEPRDIPLEKINEWIARDEEAMRRINEVK